MRATQIRKQLRGLKPTPTTISIKYPLIIQEAQLNTISAWLTHDARHIAPTATYPPTSPYTLVDLWVDALRLGFIFAGSGAELYQLYATESRDALVTTIKTHLQREYGISLTAAPADFAARYSQPTRATKGGDFSARLGRKLTQMLVTEQEFKKFADIPSHITDFASRTAQLISPTMGVGEQFGVLARVFGVSPSAFRAPDKLTLTCVPDPKLSATPLAPTLPGELVFWQRHQSLSQRVGESHTSSLLGFCPNFNNLSNFLNDFLVRLVSDREGLASDIVQLVPAWGDKRPSLLAVLSALSARASALPPHPHTPTANSYADFRMTIGGKLQSWWTSYKKHRARLAEYPPKLQIDLDHLLKRYPLATAILELLPEIEEPGTYTTTRQLLASLRDEVTRDYAQSAVPDTDWQKQLGKDYPTLFAQLPKYPAFYGDTITDRVHSLVASTTLLPLLLSHSRTILAQLPPITASLDLTANPKMLTKLRRHLDATVLLATSLQFAPLKEALTTSLATLNLSIYESTAKSRYYLHPRTRNLGNASELTLPQDPLTCLKQINQSLSDLLAGDPHSDWTMLADQIEISKRLAALRLAFGDTEATPIIPLDPDPRLAYLPIAVYAPHLTHASPIHRSTWLSLYLNRVVFANLRGLLTQASRTHALERTTLTHIGTDKKWVLIVALDPAVPSGHLPSRLKDNLAYYRHVWYLGIPGTPSTPHNPTWQYHQFSKDGSHKPITPKLLSTLELFPIQSSYVQLQHLEMLLYTPVKKQGLALSFGEPTLIHENTLARVGDTWHSRGTRLFVNYPLSYSPAPTHSPEPHRLLPHRYLGIDVGEYGLAYAVIQGDATGRACQLIAHGFITEPEHRSIRQEVAALKSRQVSGTLTRSSTKLERLRDSASTAYHHRLLYLAYHHQAQLVFEHEIDAFETGGNRIKVLYRSIKQGLTLGDTDIAKESFRATWGQGKWEQLPAMTVSAYATSTICPTCGRSLYQVDSVGDPISLGHWLYQAQAHSTYFAPTPVLLFTQSQRPDFQYSRQLIYAAARPPYAQGLSARLASIPTLSGLDYADLARRRGNQAIFLCPFVECANHTRPLDADLQAAINIAIKRYAYDLNPQDKAKSPKENAQELKRQTWFAFIQQLVRSSNYPAIPLSPKP